MDRTELRWEATVPAANHPPVLALMLSAALGLAACAPLVREAPALTECRDAFALLDARVARTGVQDAGVARINGFDYLRTDRFLASFAGDVDSDERFGVWVERLRQLDLAARQIELANLHPTPPDSAALLAKTDTCGRQLVEHDLATDDGRQSLRNAARVPSDYSVMARILGLYPFAVPFIKAGMRRFDKKVVADYATSLPELAAPGPLRAWLPPPAEPVALAQATAWIANADVLGIPQLSAEQWQRLALQHAPVWWVETAGDYDLPGAPVIRDGVTALEAGRPVTYFLPAYTRFGGRVLPQLVYVVWFAERPPHGRLDSYAGWLDGVVWRVTLGTDGKPLLYDTIHPCGCYHYFFPARELQSRVKGGYWQEPVLFPQGTVSQSPVAVRIQSATHYVRRVLPRAELGAERNVYRLASYRELLALPDGQGGTRSLFGADGLVAGSERFERYWLWVSGVISPGAMREWGRHATAFIGERHFDDPDLLERLFVPPE